MNLTFQNKTFEAEFLIKDCKIFVLKVGIFILNPNATNIFKSNNNKYQSNVIKINMTFFKKTSREPQNYLMICGAAWKSHRLGAKRK